MTAINRSHQPTPPAATSTSKSSGGLSGGGSSQFLQRFIQAFTTALKQALTQQSPGGGSLHSGESSQLSNQGAARGQSSALDDAFQGSGLDDLGDSGDLGDLGLGGTGGNDDILSQSSPPSTPSSPSTSPTTPSSSLSTVPSSTSTGSSPGSPSTTGSTASTTGVGAVSGSGSFSKDDLHGMIEKTLSQGGGGDNSLSGPQNLPKWDPNTPQGKKNLDSFYDGIVSAQKQFYPEVPIDQFARLMVAHSAQESTLNPDIENGDGLIQANQSVRDDFAKYGKTLKDNDGKVIAEPGSADSKDPASCVMLWAWRTRSCLDHGGNGPAQWSQGVKPTQSDNFGNALSIWFQGPASQPFYNNGKLDTSSNHLTRMQGFFEKAGGSSDAFQKLAGIQLGSGT